MYAKSRFAFSNIPVLANSRICPKQSLPEIIVDAMYRARLTAGQVSTTAVIVPDLVQKNTSYCALYGSNNIPTFDVAVLAKFRFAQSP